MWQWLLLLCHSWIHVLKTENSSRSGGRAKRRPPNNSVEEPPTSYAYGLQSLLAGDLYKPPKSSVSDEQNSEWSEFRHLFYYRSQEILWSVLFKTESVTPQRSLQTAIKGEKKPRGVSFAAEIKPSQNSFILLSPLSRQVARLNYSPNDKYNICAEYGLFQHFHKTPNISSVIHAILLNTFLYKTAKCYQTEMLYTSHSINWHIKCEQKCLSILDTHLFE